MDGKPRLLDQVRERIRLKHYSIRTERVYCEWIKRYVRFHNYRHPSEMGAAEVEAFLSDLAVRRDVSASTQNQALAALLFLYKQVLKQDLPWLGEVVRARKPSRLPVVLSIQEVQQVLGHLEGEARLVTRLLYGAGLRLMEALRLRVKDVYFSRNELLIRDGKGQKDRVTVCPSASLSRCGVTLLGCGYSINRHWPMAGEMSIYRMRWPASTPRRLGMGLATCVPGSGSLRRFRAAGRYAAIIWMKNACSVLSSVR